MATQTELRTQPESTTEAVKYVTLRPRVDLLESDDAWLLRAEMPGVDEHHVDVTLEKDVLTISGHALLVEPEGFERHYGEFAPRRYERSFRLPDAIDREGLEATVQHGVLNVRIPKGKELQPYRVTVKGK